MQLSTLLLYACSVILGVALGILVADISNASPRPAVKLLGVMGFSSFFLLFMGTPFFLNVVLRPTEFGISTIIKQHTPDIVASSVMLFCALGYVVTMALRVKQFTKLRPASIALIAMFAFWSAVSVYFVSSISNIAL